MRRATAQRCGHDREWPPSDRSRASQGNYAVHHRPEAGQAQAMGRPVWVSLRSEILASVGASAIKARPVDLIALQANLSKSYPAIPESVTRIRHELVDYARAAGISGEALEGVQLSVSEAVTNVVRHAYRA